MSCFELPGQNLAWPMLSSVTSVGRKRYARKPVSMERASRMSDAQCILLFSRGPHPPAPLPSDGRGWRRRVAEGRRKKEEARTWMRALRAARAPWPPPKALAAEPQGVFKPALSDGASFAKAQNHGPCILLS